MTTAKRKRMPRAERERQMLEVAERVFSERGYAAASMDEIAELVGVSKPMLYEYFRSKEGLLLACIAESRAALREVTERATVGAETAEEALRRGLLAFFVFIRERRQAWSLLRHEMALIGTPAADEIEQTRRQQTDLIAALVSGHLDSEDE
ncbi:MAG TPA: helix-turn-helix domain-containing protein, partial [Amycolatopsis sp.]